jgi:hypothetical protein
MRSVYPGFDGTGPNQRQREVFFGATCGFRQLRGNSRSRWYGLCILISVAGGPAAFEMRSGEEGGAVGPLMRLIVNLKELVCPWWMGGLCTGSISMAAGKRWVWVNRALMTNMDWPISKEAGSACFHRRVLIAKSQASRDPVFIHASSHFGRDRVVLE